MTNAERFKKTFGFTPNNCVAPEKVCKSVNAQCVKCPFNNFWDKEYKGCFELKEEFQ